MTIEYNGQTKSSVSTSANPSYTHTVANARSGAVVWCVSASDAASAPTAATFDGVSCTPLAAGTITNTTGQDLLVHGFFLGSGVSGSANATVSVTWAGSDEKWCASHQFLADSEAVIQDWNTKTQSSGTDMTVNLDFGGFECIGLQCFCKGGYELPVANTDWGNNQNAVLISSTARAGCHRYNAATDTTVGAGYNTTAEGSQEGVLITLAIREISASIIPQRKDKFNHMLVR